MFGLGHALTEVGIYERDVVSSTSVKYPFTEVRTTSTTPRCMEAYYLVDLLYLGIVTMHTQ
jgi:hypothetical protein